MGKKNNFRKEWRSLTEIGNVFGVSARKMGSMLKEHGLRNPDGDPSQLAKDKNYCHYVDPKKQKGYWLWHGKKVTEYLVEVGVKKKGVSEKEASLNTKARKLARSYMEADKLWEEGNKMGAWMFDELEPEIKKIGIDRFNAALKAVGYKGDPVTLEQELCQN